MKTATALFAVSLAVSGCQKAQSGSFCAVYLPLGVDEGAGPIWFDADEDGVLNEAEQAALKSAIEKGEVKRPGGPGVGRPPGVGGRPF